MCLPDVVNQESLEKAREEVGQLVHEEGLACLINNAGIDVDGTFETVTAEAMIKNFHTNTVAPLMITKVMFFISKFKYSDWAIIPSQKNY